MWKNKNWNKWIWSCAMVLLAGMPVLAQEKAADEAAPAEKSSLGIKVDATTLSQYLWRGYDLYSDHAVFQPSVTFDLSKVGLSGFSFQIWGAQPIGTGGGGYDDDGVMQDGINSWEELDFTTAYETTLMPEEAYAVTLGANYIYYYYPDRSMDDHCQELGGKVKLPNLFKISDIAIVPSYSSGWMWGTESGGNIEPGWYHELGLGCDLPLAKGVNLSLGSALGFNDGMLGADSDWSHAIFTASSALPLADGISLTPQIGYQKSMEETVNTDEHEFFGGLSLAFTF